MDDYYDGYNKWYKLWPPSAFEPASGGFVVLVDGKEVVMVPTCSWPA